MSLCSINFPSSKYAEQIMTNSVLRRLVYEPYELMTRRLGLWKEIVVVCNEILNRKLKRLDADVRAYNGKSDEAAFPSLTFNKLSYTYRWKPKSAACCI